MVAKLESEAKKEFELNRVVEEGNIAGRRWKRLGNGKFDVETRMGWRRFDSMEQFKDYAGIK